MTGLNSSHFTEEETEVEKVNGWPNHGHLEIQVSEPGSHYLNEVQCR